VCPAFCVPGSYAIPFFAASPYVLLEVRFHNTGMVAGLTSKPGLRVTAVPVSGASDSSLILANWLQLGVDSDLLMIPPGEDYVEVTTKVTIAEAFVGSYTLLASLSRMRSIGEKAWVETAPAAKGEPQSVACIPVYNASDQEIVPLQNVVNIHSGDLLTLHCVYNSSERTDVTDGGEGVSYTMERP
jgi:hypothetical protein